MIVKLKITFNMNNVQIRLSRLAGAILNSAMNSSLKFAELFQQIDIHSKIKQYP